MTKKRTSKKWDAGIDKRIAELKRLSLENGNQFIFILTSKETEKGTAVSGMCNSSNFNVMRAADMFIDTLPPEVFDRIMMGRALGGIRDILSKKITKKKNG